MIEVYKKKGGFVYDISKSLTIAATTATAVSSAIPFAKKVKNNKKDEKINTYRNTEK